jgi:DNA-binding GntR family transcriptional regulator
MCQVPQWSGETSQGVTMAVAMIRPLQRPVPLRQSVYDALLEAETARLAAARPASPAQLARLREICRDGQAAAETDDFGAAVAANNAFHAEVAAVGGNAVLAELADIVGRRVQWYYRMVAPKRGHGSWAEHAEMIEAIESGDAERAQALARKHTERTRLAYHRA